MKGIHRIAIAVTGVLTFGVPALATQKRNLQRGQALYVEYCLQCHGDRGEGWGWGKKVPPPPVPVPDLSNSDRMRQLSDQYLFDIVKDGGEAVGKTRFMPAAGRVLSDEEIWDVVAYVRSLSQQAHRSKEEKQ